jgi:excisionase family DNA binding protein
MAGEALAYSIDDVCKITATGRTAVFEAIRNGALRARKNGRRTLVLAADLRAWLDAMPLAGQHSTAA